MKKLSIGRYYGLRVLMLLTGGIWMRWVRRGSGYRALGSLVLAFAAFCLTVVVGNAYGHYLDVVGYTMYERVHSPYAPITVISMSWCVWGVIAAYLWLFREEHDGALAKGASGEERDRYRLKVHWIGDSSTKSPPIFFSRLFGSSYFCLGNHLISLI